MGLLPLAIETGRFNNVPREERLCKFCTKNIVEDKLHFLLSCELYDVERNIMLEKFKSHDWDHNFIKYMLTNKHYLLVKLVVRLITKRKNARPST